jgi:hypothetical protein
MYSAIRLLFEQQSFCSTLILLLLEQLLFSAAAAAVNAARRILHGADSGRSLRSGSRPVR